MISTLLGSPSAPTHVPAPGVAPMGCRVGDVITGPQHPLYEAMGGTDALGLVRFEPIEQLRAGNHDNWAQPLQSWVKAFPLVGETVLVYTGLPSHDTESRQTRVQYYYLPGPLNLFNSAHLNPLTDAQFDLPDFHELDEHHPLAVDPGDVALEGRHHQSIRLSADPEGHPLLALRTGNPGPTPGPLAEDFTRDGLLVLSRGRQLPVKLALARFDSYQSATAQPGPLAPTTAAPAVPRETVEAPIRTESSAPVTTAPSNPTVPRETAAEADTLTVPNLERFDIPPETIEAGDAEQLQLVEVQTQSQLDRRYEYRYDAQSTHNPALQAVPYQAINRADFARYSGGITASDIPLDGRALLDVLAYCEGTMGHSQNGYDVIVGYSRSEQLLIRGWTPQYAGGHPVPDRITLTNLSNPRQRVRLVSTAAGRYQFLHGTWQSTMPGKAFNKVNQDLGAWKLAKTRLGSRAATLHSLMASPATAANVIDRLAGTWDSLPYSPNGGKSYSGRGHVPLNVAQIQELYRIAHGRYTQ